MLEPVERARMQRSSMLKMSSCHTFRATGCAAHLESGATIEKAAEAAATIVDEPSP
jgi:hypothetical protein